MNITINGEFKNTNANTLKELALENKLDLQGLIILLNENIVKKANYNETLINENDILEILSFVSGG